MCLPLIACVVTIEDEYATVELLEGEVVRASTAIQPDVAVGQYVLLDRGMIIEVIDADQVEEMLQFYTELTEMWEKEDALHV
ncbi:MAG TPA: HypC/HybG/HupF family hydrogenase formation chaperone [Thermomicrobiales bacterium]|jgi:hydrogenase assembly chaperone HypC/HupF